MSCLQKPYRITFATRPEINGPIILNLGRGIRTLSDNTYTRELCLSANATVVEPEYYVLRTNPYPAPIHMVCRAHINKAHLLPN